MKEGDLVRWRHPSETDVGLITEAAASGESFVCWGDGDMGWYENIDLEVISEGG